MPPSIEATDAVEPHSTPEPAVDGSPKGARAAGSPHEARRWIGWMDESRFHIVVGVVLLGLFFAVRLPCLRADPPTFLPNGARVHELFTDPAAKSYEARNMALFGEWSTSPADNYRFWRVQAPVWVYPISWVYRLFGVGYTQMRVFSIVCAATGLLLVLKLASKRLRGWPYLLSGAFLTLNYYYIVYSRSGLVEALLNTFVVLTVFCIYMAEEHLAWLLAAQWALVLSFLTKQSGLYPLPLCLVVGAVAYLRHFAMGPQAAPNPAQAVPAQLRRGAPLWLRIAPIVQAIAIAGGMAWYVTRPEYWRTVTWNYGHMALNTGDVELKRFPLLDAVLRLIDRDTWISGFLGLFPIAGALALIEFVRIVYLLVRRRAVSRWEIILAAWGASSFGVLLLTPQEPVHYRLILFPPVVLLAGSALQAALAFRWAAARPRLAHGLLGTVLAAEVLLNATWYGMWFRRRSYSMAHATKLIRKAVGNEGAVFAGMWAGPLIFETKHKYYYIKAIFNSEREILSQLDLTHLLELDKSDLAKGRIKRSYPIALRGRKTLLKFNLRGQSLTLSQLTHGADLQKPDAEPPKPEGDDD